MRKKSYSPFSPLITYLYSWRSNMCGGGGGIWEGLHVGRYLSFGMGNMGGYMQGKYYSY